MVLKTVFSKLKKVIPFADCLVCLHTESDECVLVEVLIWLNSRSATFYISVKDKLLFVSLKK